ncbi:trypsin-like peptidase domain-containing protein [Streptomyces sp. NPDC002851]
MGQGGSRRPGALVRICDPAGRLRGTGFVADELGTVVTSHEAVDGLAGLLLHAPGDRICAVGADAVTPLPEADLALVNTEGLGVRPLPIAVRAAVAVGDYVRIAARGWRQARILSAGTPVTYRPNDSSHLVPAALELAVGTDGRDALRIGGGAAGGPVLDADTGAVLAVLGTALHSAHHTAVFAVPLRQAAAAAEPGGPLERLLARNAATVPAYGRDLNLAGALQLTAVSVGPVGSGRSDGPRRDPARVEPVEPVERAGVVRELERFLGGTAHGGGSVGEGALGEGSLGPAGSVGAARAGGSSACVLGLVGDPGCGRTTELAGSAARRAHRSEPGPTVWLRGAGLRDADASVADAVGRALEDAGRIVAASAEYAEHVERTGGECGAWAWGGAEVGRLGELSPGRVARIARDAGRPMLVLLDGPEEMPPVLAHRLAEWTAGTVDWLRETGARLVVGCRTEYWEQAGALFPDGALHRAAGARLPACVRLGDLDEEQAARARERYGLPDGALSPADARHPLALRLLAEVRAALPDGGGDGGADGAVVGCPSRDQIFSAYLDLMCLRVAVRLAAGRGLRGTAVRRLAARTSGRLHEAARRSLGPGQGELDRESFEAVFPRASGWASAVLTEGLFVPAGTGYRFAHEELADWIQGVHLDLDAALWALVHQWWRGDRDGEVAGAGDPVPRHRIGPVVQALLVLERHQGGAELALRLEELVHAVDHFTQSADPYGSDAPWWAARLLAETVSRVPDGRPYLGVLRLLAERVLVRRPVEAYAGFGPGFWRALPLPAEERMDLLRRLVVTDADRGAPGGERFLDAVGEWLRQHPGTVQPLLTRWFTDERPLPAAPAATVARAAQALLYTHRHGALDELTEALVDCAHPRGDELLAALAEEEPSALCRAVDRWAHDARPGRRAAAATYGPRVAPYARTDADRRLLRYAALTLLAR